MDLRVFAAAAASGDLATCWHNLTKDKGDLKETLSRVLGFAKSPLIQHIDDKICLFIRLARSKRLHEDTSRKGENALDGRVSVASRSSCASGAQEECAKGLEVEKLLSSDNCDDSNVCSASISEKCLQETEKRDGSNSPVDNTLGNLFFDPSEAKTSSFCNFSRKKRSLKSKQSCMPFHRHLNSLESCLLSHLHKIQTEMEEYVISSLPPPSTSNIRPLLFADKGQMISWATESSHNLWSGTDQNKQPAETYVEQNKNVLGIPPLPKVIPMEIPGEVRPKTGKMRGGRLSIPSKIVNRKYIHSRGDKKIPIYIGICIGMASFAVASRREVLKLRELLKQTENLVQDLKEEIEMNDAFTAKELVTEGYDSQDACDQSFCNLEPIAFIPELKKLTEDDDEDENGEELSEPSVSKNSEQMRIIEAELEAELERLELRVNDSGLEREEPDFTEFDPRTSSGTSGAVSPRELSSRLHQVIQSQLEERVGELEKALEVSQRKARELESKQLCS